MNTQFKHSLILWLIGFVVFSPFSSYISIDILHLPISAPEIVLIPFLPWCFKNLKFHKLLSKRFAVLVTISLLLLLISIIYARWDAYALIGTYRVYFYIIVFYSYFVKPNNTSIQDMYLVSSGATIGWLVTAMINFRTITLVDGIAVSYGPMLIISYTLSYSLLRGKIKMGAIFITLIVLIGVIGALRRVWAIMIIQMVVVIVILLRRRFVSFVKYNTLLAITIVGLILVLPTVISSIRDVSSIFYVRVVAKTESMFNGESNGGDDMRVRMIGEALQKYETDVIPKGYVSKQTYSDHTVGEFFDVPFKELTHTFGYFGAIFICLYFGYFAYRLHVKILNHKLPLVFYCYVLSVISMLALLFLEGSFLSYPYMSLYTGYSLGCTRRYSMLRFR